MLNRMIEEMNKYNKDFILSAVASSALFSLLLTVPIIRKILTHSPEIKDFSDHVMSSATAADLNIAMRINSYYIVMIGVIALFLLSFFILFRVFRNIYSERGSELFVFIKELSYVGIAGVIASIISANQDFSALLVGGAILLGWIFIISNREIKDSDTTMIMWYLLMAVPLSLFVWVISRKYNIIQRISSNVYIQKLELSVDGIYFALIWFLASVGLLFAFRIIIKLISKRFKILEDECKGKIILSGIPVIFTGIIQSIMLEVFNIVNKRFGIVLERPTLMYGFILIISFLVMSITFAILLNRKIEKLDIRAGKVIKKIYLPVILVTFALIVVQPSRMANVGSEFFEMANHGLSVDHLFKYGSIPIVETFDAHMLSNQIFAYIYSLVNGYEPWAAFLYDQFILIFSIFILFLILKSLIGEINSFFFILTFPLLENLFSMYFLLSGILLICLYKYFKEGKLIRNSIVFWFVAAFLCFYRLDLGVTTVIAGVFTYIVVAFLHKRSSEIAKFLLVGITCGSAAGVVFLVLCFIKGINPINRFIELIKLCLSNQNWAYPSVGDSKLIAFTLSYYIFPLLVIIGVVLTVGKYTLLRKRLIQVNQNNFMMFLFFSAFFIFNISRGIVRHSLAEGTLIYALGTFTLSALSFVAINCSEKEKVGKILVTAMTMVVLVNINLVTFNGSISLAAKALVSVNYQQQYTNNYEFKGTRVEGTPPSDAIQLKEILDATLEEGETYFDFSSSNYFYALVGRKNPIYANQSPLMISDDKTQGYALSDIKSKRPSFVLMPIAGKQWSYIDDIAVDYKYYMLSEYIYENYTPLVRLSNFDVYCLTSKKGIYRDKLEKLGLSNKEIYSGLLSYINPEDNMINNMIIKKDEQGYLNIETYGDDPYVVGLLTQLKGSYPQIIKNEDSDKPTKINIEYETSKSGNLQLFYTLSDSEDFSEIQSRTYEILGSENGSIEIELPSMPYEIRLDVNVADITLKGITITQGLMTINEQPENWSRYIGLIPLLWAERDGESQYKNAPNLIDSILDTDQISMDAQGIKKNQPTNLILQIDSEIDRRASIQLVSMNDKVLGEFIFNLSKGKHDYAIRISTDFKWWNDEVRYIIFSADGNVSINKFSYYAEGKSEYYNSEQYLK